MMITVVILLFCVIAAAIRRMEGSWYSPAALFSLLWAMVIVFSVLSAPDYYFSVPALLFILFNIILFFTGGKLYEIIIYRFNTVRPTAETVEPPLSYKWYLFSGVLAGTVAVFFLIMESGSNFYVFFDLKKLMNLSSTLTEERYYGVRLSGFTMLSLTLAYFASFFSGMNLATRPGSSSRTQLVLLMIPVFAFTMIYTARAVLLFMIFIILASYIAFRPFNLKSKPLLFTRVNIIAGLTGVSLLFLVFFITQAARMQVGNFGLHQAGMLVEHLRVWFSGNVSAFSIWFDTYTLRSLDVTGNNTLAGFFELLGISMRKPGIYEEAVDVSNMMEFSNIYSLFRFLIDDFGVVIACIIVFVTGGIARKLYLDGINKHNIISGALLSGIIATILWSFVASIFAYNSVLFAWISYVIILKLEQRHAIA